MHVTIAVYGEINFKYTGNFQDDANWKQYAVHAPDVPVLKDC